MVVLDPLLANISDLPGNPQLLTDTLDCQGLRDPNEEDNESGLLSFQESFPASFYYMIP